MEDILDTEEDIDIPLGPGNMIEPAEFDGMQSTHFDGVPAANYRLRFREDGLEFKDRTGFTGGAVTVSETPSLRPFGSTTRVTGVGWRGRYIKALGG